MEIREERRGSIVVLSPVGDMDLTSLPDFGGRLDTLLASGVRGIVWDLGGVGIMPSSGVGFLLQAGRRLKDVGGLMAIANAGKLARNTLNTLGVLDVFQLFGTTDDAVQNLVERLARA